MSPRRQDFLPYGYIDRYRSDGYLRRPSCQRNTYVMTGSLIAVGIVFVLAIIFTANACSAPQKLPLTVGINTPFPPFEMHNGEEISGFDVDLAQKIASSMGRQLVIKDFSEFDALLPTLEAGKLDMVISALTIREDRAEVVSFSDPYFSASQALLTLKVSQMASTGSPGDFAGLKVGYQAGTTSESWIKDNLLGKVGIKEATPFGDLTVGLQLLRLKSVDVIILDEPVATSLSKSQTDLAVSGKIETGEKYGVAVAHSDPHSLLPAINKTIRDLQAKSTGSDQSEYDKLIQKWFGGTK